MSVQTSYSLAPGTGLAGQLLDSADCMITSYPAGEALSAGYLVVLSSGVLALPAAADAVTPPKIVGVVVYDDAREPGQYAIGDMVPVLRRGRIFAAWSGTTQAELTAPKITHSSATGAKGTFTDASATAATGAEIGAAPEGCLMLRANGTSTTVCCIELNLPA